jgi:hypothetical protein
MNSSYDVSQDKDDCEEDGDELNLTSKRDLSLLFFLVIRFFDPTYNISLTSILLLRLVKRLLVRLG